MKIISKYLEILLLVLSATFLLFSCTGNNEEEVNLGDGIYYIPSQDDISDQTTFDGNGIYTYRNNSTIPIIYPEIKDYMYDSLYIIVKQRFDFKETNIMLSWMIFHPGVYFVDYDKYLVPLDEKYVINAPKFNNSGLEKKYVDSIMHLDSHIKKMMEHTENYYIINKKKQEVMGPFSKAEFNEKREALQMPEELIFE